MLAAFIVLIGMRLVAAAWLLQAHTERDNNILGGDARRYDEISNSQGTPYKDFEVEYPPISLALVEATHGFDQATTLEKLIVSELVLDLATVGVLAWAWDRRTALAYLVLSTPMILFPFLYVRIDLLSVFLATLGLGLVRAGCNAAGGATMAVSIYAKVWPAVLLPVLLIERKTKATVAWVISAAVVRRRLAGMGRHRRARPGAQLPRVEGLADREHGRALLPLVEPPGLPRRGRRVAHRAGDPRLRPAAAHRAQRRHGAAGLVPRLASAPGRRRRLGRVRRWRRWCACSAC